MATEGSRSRFSTSEGRTGEGRTSEIRQQAMEGYQRVGDMVGRNPASAMFLSFGIGLGVGLLLGMSLAPSRSSRRTSWSSRGTDYARMAERLGQQVLDSLSNVLPESLSHMVKS